MGAIAQLKVKLTQSEIDGFVQSLSHRCWGGGVPPLTGWQEVEWQEVQTFWCALKKSDLICCTLKLRCQLAMHNCGRADA